MFFLFTLLVVGVASTQEELHSFPTLSSFINLPTLSPLDCNCTTMLNETIGGCEYEELVCANGGTFNAPDCVEYLPECGGQSASVDVMYPLHNCTCPSGFVGTDCSIVAAASGDEVCERRTAPAGHRYVYDDTLLNSDVDHKHVECFMPESAESGYHLRRHRLNLTIETASRALGLFRIDFRLLSRHRIWQSVRQGYNKCGPSLPDVAVQLANCTGVTNVNEAGQRLSVIYTCAEVVSIGSCGEHENETDCTSVLWNIIRFIEAPVNLTFHYLERGRSNVTLTANVFVVSLGCTTGSCALGINQHHRTVTHPWQWVYWVLGGGGGAVALALVAFAVAGRRRRRRSTRLRRATAAAATAAAAADYDDGDAFGPKFGVLFEQITYRVGDREILGDASALLESTSAAAVAAASSSPPPPPPPFVSGINGFVMPRELVAVLGPSGAGKSTLLDIVAGRAKVGTVGGRLRFFAPPPSLAVAAAAADVVGYVAQTDVFLHTQTVRETLLSAALMRLPAKTTAAAAGEHVERLLRRLRLDAVADSRCGRADGSGGGISGGERKRLAIGIELLLEPRILVLDEPISGLDSASAALVLSVLSDVAAAGAAVLLSIHQPTKEAFFMFNRVLLLTRRGEMAFLGHPTAALAAMARGGFDADAVAALRAASPVVVDANAAAVNKQKRKKKTMLENSTTTTTTTATTTTTTILQRPTPKHRILNSNPAELMLDVASHHDDEALNRLVRSASSSVPPPSSSSSSSASAFAAARATADASADFSSDGAVRYRRPPPSYFRCFITLFIRSLRHLIREPRLLLLQWLLTVAAALFIGIAFLHLGTDLPGTQNRTGVLFFTILYFSLASLSSLPVLMENRVLFLRERAAATYSTAQYYVAYLLADLLPLRLLPPLLYAGIMYYLVGLNGEPLRFLMFSGVVALTNVVATAACFAVAAATPYAAPATLGASIGFIFSLLFGGLLLNGNNPSNPLLYVQYASFIHYAFSLLMTNEFVGRRLLFDPKFNGHTIVSVEISGEEWISNFGVKLGTERLNLAVLGGLVGFFLVFGYIALLMAKYRK